MSRVIADRVMETTTSTGTGPVALAAAVVGFQRFNAVCTVGDTVDYAIYAVDSTGAPTGAWETGTGIYSAANVLTRTSLQESSTGSIIDFAAGTKYVMLSLNAAGVGTGGGGSDGAAPTIVQTAYSRSRNADGPLVLPAAPTPGNLLVMLWSGSGGNVSSPPSGFSLLGFSANNATPIASYQPGLGAPFQGVWAATRRVQSGDGTTYTAVRGADVNNYALLEITDADMAYFQVTQMQTSGLNFTAVRQRPLWKGLHLAMMEHDGTGSPSVTSAGATILHSYTNSDTFNHCGALVSLAEGAGDIAGTFSDTIAYPVTAFLSIAKRVASSGPGSRIVASARVNCATDPMNPAIVTGINVASVVRLDTGLYRATFTTAIDPTRVGFNASASFGAFGGRAIVGIGVERNTGYGLTAAHVDFSTFFQTGAADIDNWLAFELYDAGVPA